MLRAIFSERARRTEPKGEIALELLKMLRCEPPQDQSELDRAGLGYSVNADFGDAEAFFHTHLQPRYDFLVEGQAYIDCETGYGIPPETWRCMGLFQGEHRRLFGVIKTVAKKGVIGWADWHTQMWSLLANSTTYGLGICYWPDTMGKENGGWRFKSIPFMDFLPPPRAQLDPESWDMFFIRGRLSIYDLLKVLQDPEAGAMAGWDVPSVRSVLFTVIKSGFSQIGSPFSNYSFQDPWENVLFDNDLYYTYGEKFQTIYAVTAYVRERKGAFGWRKQLFVLREDASTTQQGGTGPFISEDPTLNGKEIGYLFSAPDTQLYDKASEIICLWPENYAIDGYIEEIRGPVQRMHPCLSALNDFRCRMMDSLLMSSSTNIQPNNASDLKRINQLRIQMGGINVIPPGFNMLQTPAQAGGVGTGLVALTQELERMLSGRKATYDAGEAAGQSNTVYGQKQAVAGAASMSQYAANRDANAATAMHGEIVRRMFDKDFLASGTDREEVMAVKTMLTRLEAKGCTREYLDGITSIVCHRQLANGNPGLALQHISGLENFRARMTPVAQAQYDHEAASAVAGPYIAERLFPMQRQMGDSEYDIADLENDELSRGTPKSAKPWHNAAKHMAVHTPAAVGLVEQWSQYEQQAANNPDDLGTLQQFNSALNAYLTHCIGDGQPAGQNGHFPHLPVMAGIGNEAEYKEYAQVWNQIANVARRVAQMTATAQAAAEQKQAEMAAQPPPMSPSEQAKVMTEQLRQQVMQQNAIKDQSIKEMRAMHDMELSSRKAGLSEAITGMSVQQDETRKSQTHQVSQALEMAKLGALAQKTQVETSVIQQKAKAEIDAMRMKAKAQSEAKKTSP
jgi:hypothetical protein